MGGHHERTVLCEGAFIAQVEDVLPRSPLARLSPPGNRIGPVFVKAIGMPVDGFLQVGADFIEVDFPLGFSIDFTDVLLFNKN